MSRDTEAMIEAADHLAETFAPNWDMLSDTWQSLGCEEIEAMAALFAATGHATLAAAAIYDHAGADQEGDAHLHLRGLDWPTARRIIGY